MSNLLVSHLASNSIQVSGTLGSESAATGGKLEKGLEQEKTMATLLKCTQNS